MGNKFSTKDSGEREKYENGMVRDTQKDKDRFDLCDKSMYLRWAQLMARGAEKYGDNNWRKAASKEELDRFKSSAERHFMYWLMGLEDEDHAAATWFNIVAYEVTKDRINKPREAAAVLLEEQRKGLGIWKSDTQTEIK